MSPLELIAAALGLANIVLLVRRSVWNYPVALVMVSLYALLFQRERLYSDALLQLFFFVVNIWGWRLWLRAAADEGTIRVRRLSWARRAGWAAAGGVLTIGWGMMMARWTDASLPYADAGVAVPSVIAQVLLARRYLENWWIWIAVDAGSLPLYAAKGLYPTVGLYALMLILSVAGLRAWARAEREA